MNTIDEYKELVKLLKKAYEEGVQAISREDARKLKGFGLFAEIVNGEVKIGMRIRTVAGRLTPEQFRTIGELALKFSKNYLEITNRQGFQLHYIDVNDLEDILMKLINIGLTTKGGCGDTARAITTCPVTDIDKEQLFDVTPIVKDLNEFYYKNWKIFGNLPRKFKVSITACPYWCTDPEAQCLSFIGVKKDGKIGFTPLIGGGLSVKPRLARHMPIFIPLDSNIILSFVKAFIEIWLSDPRYRVRHRARIKFLVDDYGVKKIKELIEEKLNVRFESYTKLPRRKALNAHVGVHEQKQKGMYYIGIPVTAGYITGKQAIELADIVEDYSDNGEIRLSTYQNIIITNIPKEKIYIVTEKLKKLGFILDNWLAAYSIACTGKPFCIYSSLNTKQFLKELITHIAKDVEKIENTPIRISVTGCRHDCGKTWLADIGLVGKTLIVNGARKAALEISIGPPGRKKVLGTYSLEDAKNIVKELIKNIHQYNLV